jgi:hypothetical protein
MRLGTVLSIITRAINTRLRFPLQVWRGCVGMDNALSQKTPFASAREKFKSHLWISGGARIS